MPSPSFSRGARASVDELQATLVRTMVDVVPPHGIASVSFGAALDHRTGTIYASAPLWGAHARPFNLLAALSEVRRTCTGMLSTTSPRRCCTWRAPRAPGICARCCSPRHRHRLPHDRSAHRRDPRRRLRAARGDRPSTSDHDDRRRPGGPVVRLRKAAARGRVLLGPGYPAGRRGVGGPCPGSPGQRGRPDRLRGWCCPVGKRGDGAPRRH